MTIILLLLLILLPPQAPTGDHHAGVNRRGDAVMGFSHEKTTHHFRLRPDGGEIEATANDPEDAGSAAQIRGHFAHIAAMFAAGDFTAPMLIHAQDPPGTKAMARLKDAIAYSLEPLPSGVRLRIRTASPEALEAIHAFLRFQITDHKTGDPLTIQTE
jgi:hypothetical protein